MTITSDPHQGSGPLPGGQGAFLCAEGAAIPDLVISLDGQRTVSCSPQWAGCHAPAHKGGDGSHLTSHRQPRESIGPAKTVSVAASPTGSVGPGAFLGLGAGAQAPGSSSAAYIVHRARQVGATPRAEVGKASPSLWGRQVQLSSLSHAGAHTQDFPGPGGSAWIQGWDGGDQGLRSSQGCFPAGSGSQVEDTIQRPCNPLCLLTPAGSFCGPQLTRLTLSLPALQIFSLKCPGRSCWGP